MEISENSRVWIYQANRPFSGPEQRRIEQILGDFIKGWDAHGHKLASGYEIRYGRFVILMVDESVTAASGCSIDKSSNIIRQIEQEFGVNLFDRFNMAYRKDNEVVSCSKSEFEALLQQGVINENTVVFNNTVQTKKELDSSWEVPFKESWHSRFFQQIAL
ncbi:ABC transporter ATPase [Arcticibacter tournemirensis]|uniref:ABC transporter ATPase n=1 Tax=Arcticibacter tournemirensis TaxID=699437 RepID=A0A4Q0MDF5_9SPHI|nr:ABC transporter ATPase [Arcticibacter tournemirensis]RXF71265.1 ABC transporter ATPase [Arcticibacter tournemirensis]